LIISLSDLGRRENGIAWTAPFLGLPLAGVQTFLDLARQLDQEFGFSKEHPPRLRGVHHLDPRVPELLVGSGILDIVSQELETELALHPSTHFGCSFNWTRWSLDGFADPWHLDAAPITLLVLLSSPEVDYSEGHLVASTMPPEALWERRRTAEVIPEISIRSIGPAFPGYAVLLNGRQVPHAVGRVLPGSKRDAGLGRMTLAVGLHSPNDLKYSLLDDRLPTAGELRRCWSLEAKKAESLASLEKARRRLVWNVREFTRENPSRRDRNVFPRS